MKLMNVLKIKKIHPKAVTPSKATDGSACFDLYCCEEFLLSNGSLIMVKTGLVFEIPEGYHVEICSRSGMAKSGIIIPNSPGIVDSDYRGEVMVMLYGLFMGNHEIFQVGSKIAQCKMVENTLTSIEIVNELSDTERGAGGFGSTGT